MESNYDNEEERASQAGILRVDARAAEELSRGQTDTVYVERIVSNPEHWAEDTPRSIHLDWNDPLGNMTACILLPHGVGIGGTGVNDQRTNGGTDGRTCICRWAQSVRLMLWLDGGDAREWRAVFEGLLHSENRHKFKLWIFYCPPCSSSLTQSTSFRSGSTRLDVQCIHFDNCNYTGRMRM